MATAGASLHGPHFELFLWLRDRTPAGGSTSTGAGMTGPVWPPEGAQRART